MTTSGGSLTVRTKPSTNASKLGTYKNGATVTITGQYNDGDSYNGTTVSGDWYQISVSGPHGLCFGRLHHHHQRQFFSVHV